MKNRKKEKIQINRVKGWKTDRKKEGEREREREREQPHHARLTWCKLK
jgi:hypothetical protein